MQTKHWQPVVEIATDAGPDVSRFKSFEEWGEVTRVIQDSIEAVIE